MKLPRIKAPDWVIYGGVAVLVLIVAANLKEKGANSPEPPPPVPGEEGMPLGPGSPFGLTGVVKAPARDVSETGTAFSVADHGVWLTARHVVENCRRVVLLVAEGKGVATEVILDDSADVAVLTTSGGTPTLAVAAARVRLKPNQRGYFPGYPQAIVGEATARYIGREILPSTRRGVAPQQVLAWAETGRTDGLKGSLKGLAGAPVLDTGGHVIGVTVGASPRRGRIYTTGPEAIGRAMAIVREKPATVAPGDEAISVENYGRVADSLRRNLRVARVVCLTT